MLHDDLLQQARDLASSDRHRPKQASLRRAISTSYYALFHALGFHISRTLLPASPTYLTSRAALRRTLEHAEMSSALAGFATGNPAEVYRNQLPNGIPASIQRLARIFRDLQHQRHLADYSVASKFSRVDAYTAIRDVAWALTALDELFSATSPAAIVLSLALVSHNRLKHRAP